jgi:hypothetical protein
MKPLLIHLVAAGTLTASVALAQPSAPQQPSAPEQADGRFSFHRADGGYLRLDGRTGQVSSCNRQSAGWQCQLVPDERSALEGEIARLQRENAALKRELLSHNLQLPQGIRPQPPASIPNDPAQKGRGDAELNRVLDLIEHVWRRLVDMIANMQDTLKRI